MKFYVTLQDAITNIKQQCSDFVMTRNIQCREMIDDVQRQMAGFSFQDDKKTGAYNNYPPVGQHQSQRASPQPHFEPHAQTRPQIPDYQQQQQQPGYGAPPQHHSSPYGSIPPQQQPQPPYHSTAPANAPYPPPPQQQPPAASHEYGQPAYPGWRGPYYNAPPQQQQGNLPRPPYTIPSPYPPPHQGGYYKQ